MAEPVHGSRQGLPARQSDNEMLVVKSDKRHAKVLIPRHPRASKTGLAVNWRGLTRLSGEEGRGIVSGIAMARYGLKRAGSHPDPKARIAESVSIQGRPGTDPIIRPFELIHNAIDTLETDAD